jgi:hypothetical protein
MVFLTWIRRAIIEFLMLHFKGSFLPRVDLAASWFNFLLDVFMY